MAKTDKKIKGYECKHVFNVPSNFNGTDDLTFVKENIHYEDGTIEPSIRMMKNFERDFYITREGFQKHEDKKESELIGRLQKTTTNQRRMPERIARLLKKPLHNLSLRRLARSQYLYGTDIGVPAIVKHGYQKRFPNCTSESKVAVTDIETDVVHGTGQILSVSLTMKDKCLLVINEFFVKHHPNIVEDVKAGFDKYLGEYKKSRNIDLIIHVMPTPGQCVTKMLEYAHDWQPDWMVCWNINFDLPKMIEAVKLEGYNVADVFCDPRVPAEFRYVEYIEGPAQKVTASGRVHSLNPWERWHTFNAPATFYWICAMSTYAFIRKAEGKEPNGYGLDAILNKILGVRKLNFKEADGYTKLKWHQFMQSNFKVEYLVYNLFDCISVELLDEKIKDLAITLPELCGFSDFCDFKSTPKQLADDLHYYLLEEKGKIIASTSDKMRDDLDDLVITMDGHIITLSAHLVIDNGIKCIKEFPHLSTLIRLHVADLDVKSAYPYGEIIMNISKATTALELTRIRDIPEEVRRIVGLNLTGGATNAVEYCTLLHRVPQLDDLLAEFEKDIALGQVPVTVDQSNRMGPH